MINAIKRIQPILLFSIPFFLLFSIFIFTQSASFINNADTLSAYLILDLLLTVPLVYYLVIRKTEIPKTTVVPVIIIGLIMGYYLLPVDQHHYLDMFKQFGVPVIEVSVMVFIVLKVRSAIKKFKANKETNSDFYTVLQSTCREIVPGRMSSFLASEISVIYYGFLNWEKPILSENEFTYHKKSGSPAMFGALIFIVFVETIAVHIVLLQWSHLAATILSILSVYTGLQLLGFMRSLSKRPTVIGENELILRYGVLSETTIQLEDIESIELSRKTVEINDEARKLSILGDIESHNIIIKCKVPQKLEGIYGITKSYTTLAFHIDEKERFKLELENAIEGV